MRILKIFALYLIALALVHFSVQKKLELSSDKETAGPSVQNLSPIHSMRSPASVSKSPKSPHYPIRSVRARSQNFLLKAGSDFCPKDLIFTERKDCGGFEISDTNLLFKDQFCQIGRGVQKSSIDRGNGYTINQMTTTQKDGKRYTKKQVNTAFHKKSLLQKSQSEIQLIIQGKEILLDYSIDGSGSSCLYAVAKTQI